MARLVDWLRRRAQRPGPQGEVRPGFRPQHDDADEIPELDLRLAEVVDERVEPSDGPWRVWVRSTGSGGRIAPPRGPPPRRHPDTRFPRRFLLAVRGPLGKTQNPPPEFQRPFPGGSGGEKQRQ